MLCLAIALGFVPGFAAAQDRSTVGSAFTTASRSFLLDDSGFNTVQPFILPVRDPLSLEHIRDCYAHPGQRGIKAIAGWLSSDRPAADQVRDLCQIARLHLYEGEPREAGRYLAQARALVGSMPGEDPAKANVVWLQAVAALRLAQDENDVADPVPSSSILPLDARAVHRKREGATAASGFLREYLKIHPESFEARWLLNLSCMMLGEYPAKVPPEFLIPATTFKSEVDIGRFRDVARQLKVTRCDPSGGAIMDDFDNDGLLDIVETSWDFGKHIMLYRNRGDGTFEDRSREAGLEKQLGGFMVVQTDYDNDGRLDLFVSRTGMNRAPIQNSLLRNCPDGIFRDVTREAKLPYWGVASLACAWGDYDNDGWVDVYVCVEGARSRLYHNLRNGKFEEVGLKAGVENSPGSAKGANWADFDNDGYLDLHVANFGSPPRLYHNNRDGTFTDLAPQMGITRPFWGFSCFFFDYDNDGWLDLFASAFVADLNESAKCVLGLPVETDTSRLYRNIDGKQFEDVTEKAGLGRILQVMGSNFFDADNDGFLDLYLGTGNPPYSMLVPNLSFKNMEGKHFANITYSSGMGHLQKGHAVSCGDWDRDGNVDVYMQIGGVAPGDRYWNVLFQNPGHANHWLTVRLVGKRTNRAAFGARIKLVVGGSSPRQTHRVITAGSSFGANSLYQTIGLGTARTVDTLEVHWPASNTTQTFTNVPADQSIQITESESRYEVLKATRVPFKVQE